MLEKMGKRIKRRRISLGLTQEQLAEKVGYTSNSSINKIENGQVDLPQTKIAAIADALYTTPVDLIWDTPSESFPVSMNENLRPVYASIVAGVPMEAQTDIIEEVPIERPNPERYFGIKVNGTSMIDAGVPDGCIAIFRSQQNADNGQIVAACLNGETTLKHFTQFGETIYLLPANPAFDPIVVKPEDEFHIYGVLVETRKVFD